MRHTNSLTYLLTYLLTFSDHTVIYPAATEFENRVALATTHAAHGNKFSVINSDLNETNYWHRARRKQHRRQGGRCIRHENAICLQL